jgi:hypothetical protein
MCSRGLSQSYTYLYATNNHPQSERLDAMKKLTLTILGLLVCTKVFAQEWIDLPDTASGTKWQIRAASMFSVRDDSPLRTLYYGVEIRQLTSTGKVTTNQTIAFKESDCDSSTGELQIQHANKTQTATTFNSQNGSPHGIAVRVVCNVIRKVLK